MTKFNKEAAHRQGCVRRHNEGYLTFKSWKPFIESKYDKLGSKDDKGREYSFYL